MKHAGTDRIRTRGRVWCALALLFFLLLARQVWSIQITRHKELLAEAEKVQARSWPILAPRGNIYDRNGTPLALNLKLHAVAADPSFVRSRDHLAAQLAPLLRKPEGQLASKLASKEGVCYVALCDSVDAPIAEAITKLDAQGVIVTTKWKRVYPHQHLAAALLGFVGTEPRGLAGIEGARNDILAGADGEMLVVLDGRLPRARDEIPTRTVVTRDMRPGSSISLTIDLEIQAIAEEELAKAVESAQAAGGTAIVMDPTNGDVLALATQPGFDPNDFQRYPQASWVSSAVASPYEPGSTFKLIAACAALEEGVMSHGEAILCTGSYPVGRHTIKCAPHAGQRAHGEVGIDDMLVHSCNVGMARVALALGPDRMHKWMRRFGFGSKTGVELMGESRGILSPPEQWSQVQLATIGFGQGVSATPLQMLSAYCAVANGGWLVSPRIIKSVTDPSGRVDHPARPDPVRILSTETCNHVRSLLVGVVEEGTGRRVQIPGRRVAGKTGTAQKPTPEEGFSSGKYVASFIGFAPADNPRLAILVVIDEPKGSHYGGVVAAPPFRAICERSLAYLGVPPDEAPLRHDIALAGGRG